MFTLVSLIVKITLFQLVLMYALRQYPSLRERNRRTLLYKINDDGQIFEKPKHIIRRKLVAMGPDDMITSCEASVIRELCLMRDGYFYTELVSSEIYTLLHDICTL